ncbi:MAG TPA: hypothetical protein VH583_05700 [Vicinamibacterales bacterium]
MELFAWSSGRESARDTPVLADLAAHVSMQFAEWAHGIGRRRTTNLSSGRCGDFLLQSADHTPCHARDCGSGPPPVTSIEVATNTDFMPIVIAQPISASRNGQSTATIERLSAATTYYWHVRTTAGDNPSTVSATSSFTISPQVMIQAPMPAAPLAGTFQHKRPEFTVVNGARTGPISTVTYRFEVATDASFSTLVASGTVAEGEMRTSFVPNVDLVPGTAYVWRAEAMDKSTGITSAYSSVVPFTIVNPEDGTYRYTLTFSRPPSCEHGVFNSSFNFDDGLVVTDNHLRFVLPDDGSSRLDLEMTRLGNHLTGTVSGTAPYGDIRFEAHGTITGTSDSAGRIVGTLDGQISEDTPSLQYRVCKASDVMWTLTPH